MKKVLSLLLVIVMMLGFIPYSSICSDAATTSVNVWPGQPMEIYDNTNNIYYFDIPLEYNCFIFSDGNYYYGYDDGIAWQTDDISFTGGNKLYMPNLNDTSYVNGATICSASISTYNYSGSERRVFFEAPDNWETPSCYCWSNGDIEESVIPNDAVSFNGNKYVLYDNSLSWTEAQEYCESIGGHLVTITSQEEQEFINNMLISASKNLYWIGLFYNTEQDELQWVTNEDVYYLNWASGEPNDALNRDEDYTHLFAKNSSTYFDYGEVGEWNDTLEQGDYSIYFGVDNFGFICEWESDEYVDYLKIPSFSSAFANAATGELSSIFSSIISKEMPCKPLIEAGGVELVTWNAFALSIKSLSEFKIGVDEKSFYQAILFDLISDTYSSVDYEKEVVKSTLDIVVMATDYLVQRKVDIAGDNLTKAELDSSWWPAYRDFMEAQDVKFTKEAFDALLEGCYKAEECINIISAYAAAMQQGQNLIDALKLMSIAATNDPNAQTLKESIDELVEMMNMTPGQMTAYVLAQENIETSITGTINITYDWICSSIKEAFKEYIPMQEILKISDWSSNIIFPTSLSSEQQYRIYALYHIECVIRSALFTSINNYLTNKTDNNAQVMVSCYDMFVRVYEHEIVDCKVLAELLHKKGVFNFVSNCFSSNSKDDYYSAIDWLDSYYVMLDCAKEFKEKIYINWGVETGNIKSFKCIGVIDGKIAGYTERYVNTGETVTLPDYSEYKNCTGFLDNTVVRFASQFEGWYYDEACTQPCYSNSVIANEHIVRYAKFVPQSGKQVNVKCPVDVAIYNESNELCVKIVNNQVVYDNGELRIDIVDNNKSVFIPNDEMYSVKLVASEEGTMNYSVTEINNGSVAKRVNFYDVSLCDDQQFSGTIEEGLELPKEKYALSTINTEDEDVLLQPDEEINTENLQSLNITVSVEGNGSATNGVLATKGDYVKLTATAEEKEAFIGWYNNDELVTGDDVYSFVAKDNMNITAKFTKYYPVTDSNSDNTITVLFENSENWGDINYYAWGGVADMEWPGEACTNIYDNIWSATIPSDSKYIVFNDGENQTADIVLEGGNKIAHVDGNSGTNDWGDSWPSVTWDDFYLEGDAYRDSRLNIIDATYVQLYLVECITSEEVNLLCADVDEDEVITVMDATLIQMYIAQLIPSL